MSASDPSVGCFTGFSRLIATASAARRLTREEGEALRAFGEQAAADGTTLRQLVARHLRYARANWSEAPDSADSTLAMVVQAIDAMAEGYDRAQHHAVRRQEAARSEFLDDLLHGHTDLGRLAERADRFGLRLSHDHAVAVATGPALYAEGDDVPRRVERAVTSRFGERQTLLTTKEGRLVCVAPGDRRDVLAYFAEQARAAAGGGRTAIGRSHRGAGGVVHSFEEALDTLALATRLGLEDPVLDTADFMVYPVLTRDRQAMADLVRTALGPLLKARGGPETSLTTLTVYFEAGCNTTEAARRLSLSARALTYRLERIHRLTGTDPTDPLQRYTLQTAIIGARLLKWPAQSL
ncbi:helix-turn-helix domain-containing protein [Streptomyces sp. NPDC006289]|uniref:PucR family transcriptional regulator n=1 Tax=Streptomyces sp. NPDC006289 TaxID=3156744 RepID=UPI0033A79D40